MDNKNETNETTNEQAACGAALEQLEQLEAILDGNEAPETTENSDEDNKSEAGGDVEVPESDPCPESGACGSGSCGG